MEMFLLPVSSVRCISGYLPRVSDFKSRWGKTSISLLVTLQA